MDKLLLVRGKSLCKPVRISPCANATFSESNMLCFDIKTLLCSFLLLIIAVASELHNGGETLINLFTRNWRESFLPELIIKKKKKNAATTATITAALGCPFDCPVGRTKGRTTFDCIRRHMLKNSKKLFYMWSSEMPKIQSGEKLNRQKISSGETHYTLKKKVMHKSLNYYDLSSLNTHCSFYKLCVRDLLHFERKKGGHNNADLGLMRKRYFVKTDHLNSDPLEEKSYIFITGQKKEILQRAPQLYNKFHKTLSNTALYYYVILMNKALDHTFYFVYKNEGGYNNNNRDHNPVSNNYIIYKNEIIYPFRVPRDDITIPYKNCNATYDDLTDFYIIEICHCFNGITFKQNVYSLSKRLSSLYFNIELVPYIFDLPPVFYHILIILICSLIFAYIFYNIFLKYKRYL
ncbi:conserved Plasmodium protein, unknown function [Plasmodium ovale wallikeri]|uniref:Uncharacterized protein n=1 Tax=Plasmodium ovale wallikeri TaxID=864142 RepID=A0A1A8Z1G5_PLAOA|nr:conserved Plasmodium protein, unknown function [Plasmodium ovale wallikeri]